MNKFGGRQPTGTPSLAWSCVVVIASLLAGAAVVHNIFKSIWNCLQLRGWVRLEEALKKDDSAIFVLCTDGLFEGKTE